MPEPTSEQHDVIEHLRGNLVVRAGAGSGKTFVLARRFARALESGPEWPPAELDEIVAITFTRKAATELLERVRRSLLAREGGVDRSRRIDEAWATTIDSFCAQLLRRHAIEAGVDPAFGIASSIDTGVMFDAAYDAAVASARLAGGRVTELLDGYGADVVRSAVGLLHAKVRTTGLSLDTVHTAPRVDFEEAVSAFEVAAAAYEQAVRDSGRAPSATVESNLCVIEEIRQTARSVKQVPGLCEKREAARSLPLKPRITRAGVAADLAEIVKSAAVRLVAALAGELTEGYAEALVELARDVDARFRAEKQARGVLDFQDLIDCTSRLMRERPGVAESYREGFRLLMVDEFQDTNQTQVDLIRMLTRENLCAVGDVQQSIYSFRDADVTVFERLIASTPDVKSLSANYRSHPEVLAFVNTVFGSPEFFGEAFQRLEAKRAAGPSPKWPCEQSRVEVHVVDTQRLGDFRARYAEAEVFAERVVGMLALGVKPHDIVLLLRGMNGASVYADALRARGVPVVLASGESFILQREVQEIAAVLKLLVAPDDDAAMTRVLAGRMVGLSDDGLMALRAHAGYGSLWSALREVPERAIPGLVGDDREAAIEAVRSLERLRGRQGSTPVAETIHGIVREFDYDLTLLASGPSGGRAWANVMKLADAAATFEAERFGDAGDFLEYLDHYRAYNVTEASAPAARSGSAVRITSIHSAKGLEFPVVFVADLESALHRGESAYFYVDRTETGELYVARKMPPDGRPLEKMRDLEYERLAEASRRRQVEEGMRVFYVGCTRAEEALVLIGAAKVADPGDTHICGLLLRALGTPYESGDIVLDDHGRVDLTIHAPSEWGESRPTVYQDSVPVRIEDADLSVELERALADEGRADCVVTADDLGIPHVISYSTLWDFALCPRRYRAVRGLGLLGHSQQSSAVRLGSAVHAVLETVRAGRPAAHARDAAIATYALDPSTIEQLDRALDTALGSAVLKRAEAADRTTRECSFGLDLGVTRLAGTMDVIAWEGNHALIIDYKTGATPATGADRPGLCALADSADGHALQAACYALAAIAAGANQVEVVFLFLGSEGVTSTYHFVSADAEAIRQELMRRIEAMRSDRFGPRDSYEHSVCAECPARSAECPATPRKR